MSNFTILSQLFLSKWGQLWYMLYKSHFSKLPLDGIKNSYTFIDINQIWVEHFSTKYALANFLSFIVCLFNKFSWTKSGASVLTDGGFFIPISTFHSSPNNAAVRVSSFIVYGLLTACALLCFCCSLASLGSYHTSLELVCGGSPIACVLIECKTQHSG